MSDMQLSVEEIAAHCVRMIAEGDYADFEKYIHPEATNRESVAEPPASRGTGPAAFLSTAEWLRSAYSGMHWEIHDLVSDGDLVVLHATLSGRQTGPFVVYDADGKVEQVFPATGKDFAVTQTHWCRFADGRLIEHWANRDDLGQARQLGWAPPSPIYLFRMQLATRGARRANR
ncbi:ester cyclase [Nocardia sp. NPDC088792]|uniref:ester cyclase n=1 Tax=Nocardia sp. NPDC088792 TaxID=3364332 RepID=UPI003826F543